MKVFISWSGAVSRQVAEVLREWLPSAIQSIEPYVSSEDIDKGARWSADISQELEESNYGILCVTKHNLAAPWLNFEAGALSKSFDKSRVSPFLFGIDRTEVTGPLLQFQSTIYEKDDVLKLLRSINNSCDSTLDDGRLDSIFDVWWPSLEGKLNALVDSTTSSPDASETSKRSNEDVLEEVLTLVRAQQKILADQTEIVPYMESILRRHVDDRRDLPVPLIRDLHAAWSILSPEVAKLAEVQNDEQRSSTIRSLLIEIDTMIDYMVKRYGLSFRNSSSNRRNRLAQEKSHGRQIESE